MIPDLYPETVIPIGTPIEGAGMGIESLYNPALPLFSTSVIL